MDRGQRRSTRLTITVPASVVETLARMALEEGRSTSNLAARLLERHARENGEQS
jgi:predicted CopG family antitoxin